MNHDKETTEYFEKMASLKLSDSSRARIKNNLVSYARFHAVRVGEAGRSIEQVPLRTSFLTHILNLHSKSMIAAFLAVMLLVGGGSSYAAENAVPGDVLYPVKVDVNENIQSAFALTDTAEANLQVHLAEERMQEAETLAARGQLTATAATDLSARLKAHYETAEAHNKTVEADGNYGTSATLRASLEGALSSHASVLADLNSHVAGNNGASLVADISNYVGMSVNAQSAATATIKTAADVKVATAATMQSADALILEAQKDFANAESKLSAGLAAEAKVKLGQAVTAEAAAKTDFEAEAYTTAYTNSKTAIRYAFEVESMIKSTLRLPVNTSIKIGADTNTVIDVQNDNTTEDGTSTDTKTETGATTTSDDTSDNDPKINLDVNGEVHTDGVIKTGVIDSNVKTDTTVHSGVGI